MLIKVTIKVKVIRCNNINGYLPYGLVKISRRNIDRQIYDLVKTSHHNIGRQTLEINPNWQIVY